MFFFTFHQLVRRLARRKEQVGLCNSVVFFDRLRWNRGSLVTGPPWLYQGECYLRTVLGRNRFRSGWPQPQGPMGTNLVVVSSPTFHEHLHLP